jgi:hypothetical protein
MIVSHLPFLCIFLLHSLIFFVDGDNNDEFDQDCEHYIPLFQFLPKVIVALLN